MTGWMGRMVVVFGLAIGCSTPIAGPDASVGDLAGASDLAAGGDLAGGAADRTAPGDLASPPDMNPCPPADVQPRGPCAHKGLYCLWGENSCDCCADLQFHCGAFGPPGQKCQLLVVPTIVVNHARRLIARLIDRAQRAVAAVGTRRHLWALHPV